MCRVLLIKVWHQMFLNMFKTIGGEFHTILSSFSHQTWPIGTKSRPYCSWIYEDTSYVTLAIRKGSYFRKWCGGRGVLVPYWAGSVFCWINIKFFLIKQVSHKVLTNQLWHKIPFPLSLIAIPRCSFENPLVYPYSSPNPLSTH